MRQPLIRAIAFFSVAVALNSQTSQDYQNNSTILTSKDLSDSCQPQDGDLAKSTSTKSCCGMPGGRQCGVALNSFVNFLTGCTSPPSGNKPRGNPYNTGGPSLSNPFDFSGQWTTVCNMSEPACDDSVADLASRYKSLAPSLDLSFYVTSDIHPFRTTLRVNDSVYHVRAMNEFGSRGVSWPTETGIAPGTTIHDPLAVVIPGDLTTHGYSADLGAFRMLWEHGSTPGSIRFPIYPGLGNHDDSSNSSHNDAWRMFAYVGGRMSCGVSLDPISDNYSWDWNGLHLVQLNTWMGEDSACSLFPHGSGEDWFKADLKKLGRSGRPVVIFQHYPKSSINDSTCGWTVASEQRFLSIIADYNVIGVFAGHTHQVSVDSDIATDSFGGTRHIDWLVDGKAGGADTEDNKDESDGHGDFLAVHVTDHYLDIAAATWHRHSDRDYSPVLGDYGAPTLERPVFWGGSAACHKRINDRFINVTSLVSLNQKVSSNGIGLTIRASIQNGTTAIPGPLAIRIQGASQVSNRSFTDGCSLDAAAYVLFPGDEGLAPGQAIAMNVNVGSNDQPTLTLVRVSPLRQAVPNKFDLATALPVVTGNPLIPPDDQTFTVYGPPNQSYSITPIDVIKQSDPAWLIIRNGRTGKFDSFGRAIVTVGFDGTLLKAVTDGTAMAQIHTLWAEPQGDVEVDLSITFKHGLTVSLTSTAGTSAPPQSKVVWTANLTYMPFPLIVGGDNKVPMGKVELREQFVGADGRVTSTLLSTSIVNSSQDCPARAQRDNTAVFGDSGDGNFCPSKDANGNTPYIFSLPVGLHRIYASYTGSGIGDSTFAPADSPVVLFRVGNPIGSIAVVSGDGQTTVSGGTFDLPLRARVVDAQGVGVLGATVLLSSIGAQNGGPGATFGGSSTQTLYSDANGYVSSPAVRANAIPGAFRAAMSITFSSGDMFSSQSALFTLQNVTATGKPNILTTIDGKGIFLPQESWSLLLRNLGGPAYDVWVTGVAFTQTAGDTCSPAALTAFPLQVPSLLTPTSQSHASVLLDFTGCSAGSKFTFQVRVSANAGSYTGVTSIGNQFR